MTVKTLIKYFRVWKLMTLNSFQTALVSRFGAVLFLSGKILRAVFFLIFLIVLTGKSRAIAGYTLNQIVFFYLTFNFIDTLSQLLYREVYRFRPLVVSGSFDFILIKPVNALFRSLAGGADVLDLLMLIPYMAGLILVGRQFPGISFPSVVLFILLLINGFLIASAFHILVLSLAILTTEIDHAIMIYRDLTTTGRLPTDIYRQPLYSFLIFIIPVGVIFTFPVKAFLNLLSFPMVLLSFVLGGFFVYLSIAVWRFSLKKYASASS